MRKAKEREEKEGGRGEEGRTENVKRRKNRGDEDGK